MSKQKTALVTGAAGFLGSHLVDSLLSDGYYVIGVDNLSTGDLNNLIHIPDDNFRFIFHDITQPLYVIDDIDEIWNFACPASPKKYQEDPIHTFKTSVLGVMNLVELAQENPGCKIFHTSTSEVYGDPQVDVQDESYWGNVNTVGIRSCYDEGKRAAETYLTDYNRMYGIPVKIARIFNTYGPRMHPDDGRVLTNFITQGLRGQNLTVYGDGSQTRSFCYVTDAIRAYRKLMDTADEVVFPVNIGNPDEFKILDVAKIVCEMLYNGDTSKIVFEPLPEDDPKQRKPDISLAARVLGWTPTVPLKQGLNDLTKYLEKKV